MCGLSGQWRELLPRDPRNRALKGPSRMSAAPWSHKPQVPCDALETGDLVLGDASTRCARCEHHVHDLRSWTRARADAFVRVRVTARQRVCVMVSVAPNGDVLFAERAAVVPLERLLQRVRAAPALAGGFALAMACTTPLADEPLPEAQPQRAEGAALVVASQPAASLAPHVPGAEHAGAEPAEPAVDSPAAPIDGALPPTTGATEQGTESDTTRPARSRRPRPRSEATTVVGMSPLHNYPSPYD